MGLVADDACQGSTVMAMWWGTQICAWAGTDPCFATDDLPGQPTPGAARTSVLGQLVARGSQWVSARIDLDTTLSEIDSRLIEVMIVINRPLESRIGLRLHQPADSPLWRIELSASITERQDRVATSLLESETPGFTVWDIWGFWQVGDGVKLVARPVNFTDRNYRDYLDFRPIGRDALPVLQPGVNFHFGSELVLRSPFLPMCKSIAEELEP